MKDNPVAWLVGPILMLLGLVLLLSPRLRSLPVSEQVVVEASQIDPAPLRQPLRPPLAIRVAGYQKGCMDCHALFKSGSKTPFTMFQHREIQRAMDHGINRRCYNCHDLARRDQLALDDGSLVGFDQAVLVCAKCHGTTYRDWQRGSHGKTMGYWNESLGKRDRLTCIQCHDPHAPAFNPFKPLPGPHTLRMDTIPRLPGSGHLQGEHVHGKKNPLRMRGSPNLSHVGHSSRSTSATVPEPLDSEKTESKKSEPAEAEPAKMESGGESQEVSHE